MALYRWDPFREMAAFRNVMDRLFEEPVFEQNGRNGEISWGLPVDVAETEEGYVVKASIPGMNPDDLEITFNNNTLTLKGEVRPDRSIDENRYHLRERRYGKFVRSLTLPAKINAEAIQADYDAGELTLRLPKADEVKPKRITVQAGSAQKPKMIEGNFEKTAQTS